MKVRSAFIVAPLAYLLFATCAFALTPKDMVGTDQALVCSVAVGSTVVTIDGPRKAKILENQMTLRNYANHVYAKHVWLNQLAPVARQIDVKQRLDELTRELPSRKDGQKDTAAYTTECVDLAVRLPLSLEQAKKAVDATHEEVRRQLGASYGELLQRTASKSSREPGTGREAAQCHPSAVCVYSR